MASQNICKLYLCKRVLCFDCRRINNFINDSVEYVYRGGDSCSGNGELYILLKVL